MSRGQHGHIPYVIPLARVPTAFSLSLSASLSFSGTQLRGTNHKMTAALSFVGSLKRAITKLLAASLSFSGAVAGVLYLAPFVKALGMISDAALTLAKAIDSRINVGASDDTAPTKTTSKDS